MSKGYNPDQLWFTSDLHLFHKKVLEFCPETRPYRSVEEMNQGLVDRWNEKVKPGDTGIICGDVSFGSVTKTVELLEQMNGSKILVAGNHDSGLLRNPAFRDQFVKISPLLEIKVQDPDAPGGSQRIVCCHFALRVWHQQHRGAWHVYGHSHGTLEEDENRSMDVGVDAGVYPLSYWDVKEHLSSKGFTPVDHHIERPQ